MSEFHRLGWIPDSPDKRDYILALPRNLIIPKSLDLRKDGFLPAPYDQGNLGSCVAHAACAALEYLERKAGEPDVMRSRLEVYYRARELEGTVSQDAGCMIRDAMKALAKSGACPESLWPYDIARFADVPPQTATSQDKPLIVYRRVPQTELGIKTALVQGLPVVIGISVYSSFEGEQAQSTGVIPYPNRRREQLLGGHAMLVVGYDDAEKWWIVRNSWGSNWGAGGYCYIPYRYVLNRSLGGDFWCAGSY